MNILTEFRHYLQRFGLEYFNRYYGIYRGIVVDNKDPEKRGRLKISVPQIYGNGVYNYWAESKGTYAGNGYGFIAIPTVGNRVWVEFENGNNELPIWSQGFFQKQVINDQNYPEDKIFQFENGQQLIFNQVNNKVTLKNADGVSIELNELGFLIDRFDKQIFIGSNSDSSQAAALGDTLETVLAKMLDIMDTLANQCQNLTSITSAVNPGTVSLVTTEIAFLKALIEVEKNNLNNIKSKNVFLDE